MERKTLAGGTRVDFKKNAARRLRRSGKIPAIIYGHQQSAAVFVDESEFNKKFHTVSENTLINITTEDNSYEVLVRDYQEDTLSGRILHIDFYEIEQGKLLSTNIPIHLEGSAPGVKEGGILDHRLHEVEVECLPKDIPEYFMVDISGLVTGEVIHVSDLEVPEGVKILNNEDQAIVAITHAKIELVEEEEEEAEEEMLEGEEAEGAEEETAEQEESEEA
jgi:large subunit ribosomal protein L25